MPEAGSEAIAPAVTQPLDPPIDAITRAAPIARTPPVIAVMKSTTIPLILERAENSGSIDVSDSHRKSSIKHAFVYCRIC